MKTITIHTATIPSALLDEPRVEILHEKQLPGRWTVTLDRQYAGYGHTVAAAAAEARRVRDHDLGRRARLRRFAMRHTGRRVPLLIP